MRRRGAWRAWRRPRAQPRARSRRARAIRATRRARPRRPPAAARTATTTTARPSARCARWRAAVAAAEVAAAVVDVDAATPARSARLRRRARVARARDRRARYTFDSWDAAAGVWRDDGRRQCVLDSNAGGAVLRRPVRGERMGYHLDRGGRRVRLGGELTPQASVLGAHPAIKTTRRRTASNCIDALEHVLPHLERRRQVGRAGAGGSRTSGGAPSTRHESRTCSSGWPTARAIGGNVQIPGGERLAHQLRPSPRTAPSTARADGSGRSPTSISMRAFRAASAPGSNAALLQLTRNKGDAICLSAARRAVLPLRFTICSLSASAAAATSNEQRALDMLEKELARALAGKRSSTPTPSPPSGRA